MEAATKHKLAMGAGAIAVCGIAYYVVATQGDSAGEAPMSIGGGGLGGFGDLFRKLLGAGAGAGLGTLTSDIPLLSQDLPLPQNGQIGDDLGDAGINSTAPDPSTATSDSVQQFKQALVDFLSPQQPAGPSAESAPPAPGTYVSDAGYSADYTAQSGWYAPAGSTFYDGGPALAVVPDTGGVPVSILQPDQTIGYLNPGDPLPAPTYTAPGVELTPYEIGHGGYTNANNEFIPISTSEPLAGYGIIQSVDPSTSQPTYTAQPLDYGEHYNPGMGHDPNNPNDTN